MSILTVLAAVATITVALIRVWNTDTAARARMSIRSRFRTWRERRRLDREVERFRCEPALLELEQRYGELLGAYESGDIPPDLATLWFRVFALARTSPVKTPFRYGSLEVHQNQVAMTIRRDSGSITGSDRLSRMRIPLPPITAVKPGSRPIPVVKR